MELSTTGRRVADTSWPQEVINVYLRVCFRDWSWSENVSVILFASVPSCFSTVSVEFYDCSIYHRQLKEWQTSSYVTRVLHCARGAGQIGTRPSHKENRIRDLIVLVPDDCFSFYIEWKHVYNDCFISCTLFIQIRYN